ncbi:MAG: LysR substrate-binding domain-containing protein [Gemmobacter sp.]
MVRASTAKLLITFRAAARHLSFVHAAPGLNIQPPAVSRQIAALEAELGTPLFLRTKPRLTLTADGRALLAAVTEGFAVIERACAAAPGSARRTRLRVQCTIGFATCFLLRRLPAFEALHPDIAIDLVTRDQNAILDDAPADVAVTFGTAGLPFASARRVFGEVIFAACAPQYLAAGRLLTRDALAGERLLVLSAVDHAADWARFLGRRPDAPPRAALHYNSFAVYLKAVIDGQGIGLGWGCLMDDLLRAGTLRMASAHRRATERGYHASIMPASRGMPAAAAFQSWLAEAGAAAEREDTTATSVAEGGPAPP